MGKMTTTTALRALSRALRAGPGIALLCAAAGSLVQAQKAPPAATAAEDKRPITLRIGTSNVHAGAKYMDQLMAKYLSDADLDETNRTLFAFACYNAGPGNIRRMCSEAAKRGLDDNKWFNNVELVTAEKIGIETTRYVRNIYKYYVAYKLMTEVDELQRKAREGLQQPTK